MEVAEVRTAAQQFTQHEWGPTLSEDLGALGDRAKLTVASHRRPPPCSDDAVMIAAGGPPTSTNSGLDDGPAALFIAFGYRDACISTRGRSICSTPTVQIWDWIAASPRRMSVARAHDMARQSADPDVRQRCDHS